MGKSQNRSDAMRRRWRDDRDTMLGVVLANAAKGTAAISGRTFGAESRARRSAAQRGKAVSGLTAKGPDHIFAADFALRDPEGEVWTGRNIIDFVRAHLELFDPADLVWKAGHCRASKGLSKLRPTLVAPKPGWKEWTWA